MKKIRKIKSRRVFTANGIEIPVNIYKIGTKKNPATEKEIKIFAKKLNK